MTPPGGGSAEAARLLSAVEAWLRGAAGAADTAGQPAAEPPADDPPAVDPLGVLRDLFAHPAEHNGEHTREHNGEHQSEQRPDSPCQLCPLCRLIAAAREVRPEIVEHLVDAASSVLLAFRAVVEPAAATRPEGQPGPTGPTEEPHQPVGPPPTGVQRITVN